MKKEKKEVKEFMLGGHKAKITLGNPEDKKKADKLNAMRMALTYIESQGMIKVTPKKATEIADEFLEWLEKQIMAKTTGLGDVVHRVTKKLRIKECGGCKKRREVLNKFRIPKFKL